jgi:hypothetical protein
MEKTVDRLRWLRAHMRTQQCVIERYAMDTAAQKYIGLYEAALTHGRSLMARDGTL